MHIAMTGAATGIGAAALGLFKTAGHTVTAFDIAEVPTADTCHRVDLTDLDAARDAARKVREPVDALILNAGLPPRRGNQVALLTLNVFALIAMAAALEDRLAPGGAIVATASRAGEHWRENLDEVKALLALPGPQALPGFVAEREISPLRAYCLSKEAVIAWTQASTGRLLTRGLRVNCVSPSAVETPILGDFRAALGVRAEQAIARAGRAGTAREIAAVIGFLAAPESGWIRGQNIAVDGGVSALATSEALGLA